MRYRDVFQRIGLASMLLAAGMLGEVGLPLSSQAQTPTATPPVIQIEVSQGTAPTISTTGLLALQYLPATHADSACPALDSTTSWGPNYCYKIVTPQTFTTPNGYQVVIQDEVNQKAQLQTQDFATTPGGSPQDGMKLSGIKIVPTVTSTWNADSSVPVKVTITVIHKFDAQPNPTATAANARRLPWTISTAGYWEARETALINTSPVGDIYELFGEGTFVTTGTVTPGTSTAGQPKGIWNNSYDSLSDDYNKSADLTVDSKACSSAAGNTSDSKLCFTLAGPGNTRKVTFSGKHVAPYPGSPTSQPQGPAPTPDQRFYCTNNNSAGNKSVIDPKGVTRSYADPSCQPLVKLIHRFTLVGPDITALTGSETGGGLVCNESGTANQLPQCEGISKQPNKPTAEQILTKWSQGHIDKTLEELPNVQAGEKCTNDVCNGNLRLNLRLTPSEPETEIFPFRLDGPLVNNTSITIPAGATNSAPNNDATFTELITGRGKSKIVIQADYANWPRAADGSFFQADNFSVSSTNGNTIVDQANPNADVRIIKIGSVACGVIVHAIGNADTIRISAHAHNSTAPPVSCNLQ